MNNYDEKIATIKENQKELLEMAKEKIQAEGETFSEVTKNVIDVLAYDEKAVKKYEAVVEAQKLIKKYATAIRKSKNIDEIKEIRKKLNSCISKVKAEMKRRGFSDEMIAGYAEEAKGIRKSISDDIRFLKRKDKINEINSLYRRFDKLNEEELKRLRKLVKNELDYGKKNLPNDSEEKESAETVIDNAMETLNAKILEASQGVLAENAGTVDRFKIKLPEQSTLLPKKEDYAEALKRIMGEEHDPEVVDEDRFKIDLPDSTKTDLGIEDAMAKFRETLGLQGSEEPLPAVFTDNGDDYTAADKRADDAFKKKMKERSRRIELMMQGDDFVPSFMAIDDSYPRIPTSSVITLDSKDTKEKDEAVVLKQSGTESGLDGIITINPEDTLGENDAVVLQEEQEESAISRKDLRRIFELTINGSSLEEINKELGIELVTIGMNDRAIHLPKYRRNRDYDIQKENVQETPKEGKYFAPSQPSRFILGTRPRGKYFVDPTGQDLGKSCGNRRHRKVNQIKSTGRIPYETYVDLNDYLTKTVSRFEKRFDVIIPDPYQGSTIKNLTIFAGNIPVMIRNKMSVRTMVSSYLDGNGRQPELRGYAEYIRNRSLIFSGLKEALKRRTLEDAEREALDEHEKCVEWITKYCKDNQLVITYPGQNA